MQNQIWGEVFCRVCFERGIIEKEQGSCFHMFDWIKDSDWIGSYRKLIAFFFSLFIFSFYDFFSFLPFIYFDKFLSFLSWVIIIIFNMYFPEFIKKKKGIFLKLLPIITVKPIILGLI